MQLSWLRSTALVLVLTACGEDGGGDDGKTQDDAAVTATPKADAGSNAGSSPGSDAGVAILKDSSVPDTGTKPPVADSGPGAVADAGAAAMRAAARAPMRALRTRAARRRRRDAGGATPVDAGGGTPVEESFAALYASIFMPKCATAPCHLSATHTSGLHMDSLNSMHASLLKAVGTDQNGSPGSPCSTMTTNPRVAPGDPAKSWLLVDDRARPSLRHADAAGKGCRQAFQRRAAAHPRLDCSGREEQLAKNKPQPDAVSPSPGRCALVVATASVR